MANVLILGGGFAGVVAAESLAQRLGPERRIKLVSRHREFTFFPSLVRLAFGRLKLEDVFFDLAHTMRSRRVEMTQAEVADYDPDKRLVVVRRGQLEWRIEHDYLVFALGRRLAAERVPGFFKHAHHLLTVDAALRFGEAPAADLPSEASSSPVTCNVCSSAACRPNTPLTAPAQ